MTDWIVRPIGQPPPEAPPPVIRIGPPPTPDQLRHPRQELLVLVERRGWLFVRWDAYGPGLIDQDTRVPQHLRIVDPATVRCWLPGDGS